MANYLQAIEAQPSGTEKKDSFSKFDLLDLHGSCLKWVADRAGVAEDRTPFQRWPKALASGKFVLRIPPGNFILGLGDLKSVRVFPTAEPDKRTRLMKSPARHNRPTRRIIYRFGQHDAVRH
jgi:hypothetical protein